MGCSAQVKMVPIACASLVANATGSKMKRTGCYIRVDCHISHNSVKE